MAFEYRYRFSIDEEIISRYIFFERAKFLFETRTTFIVKGSDGEERVIDSERYAEGAVIYSKQQITQSMGRRFKDYFMPDETIKRLNDEVMIFVKGIEAGGRRGKIPVAVDLEVCTVQREGEGIAATADRAMRAEYLPPLYMYPLSIDYSANAVYEPRPTVAVVSLYFLLLDLARAAIRVEDVKKGLGVMKVCSICDRKPTIGTQISLLGCGHNFHYHCIARRLGSDISCPICHCRCRIDRNFNFFRFVERIKLKMRKQERERRINNSFLFAWVVLTFSISIFLLF